MRAHSVSRKLGLLALSLISTLALMSAFDPALAQGRGQGGGQKKEESPEDKEKKDEEWGDKQLRLDQRKADGPCPYVKVLYDAARYLDFEGGVEKTSEARYTGEINGVASDCAYKGDQPITVSMIIGFSLGKGPKAPASNTTYRYWVAVTERDKAVLAKEYFDLPVSFDSAESVKTVATRLDNIVIPRAAQTVSGSNFEILVGFDVTPQMAAFNAEGKRFRSVNPTSAAK
jgi:hypothetical protein